MRPIQTPIVHRGADQGQARFNDEVASQFRRLAEAPLSQYVILENVDIGTSPTRIDHLLGRPMVGWLLIDRTGDGAIKRVSGPVSSPANPATHFYLQSTAAERVRLLVF